MQDLFLSNCLTKREPKRQVNKQNKRDHQWDYSIPIENIKIVVCQKLILSLLQISEKRIRIIQKRLIKGDNYFVENRGHHDNRPHKLKSNVQELFLQHLATIPHSQSHYTESRRKYFDNTELTHKILFEMFQKYYHDVAGEDLQMKYKTYHRMFRLHSEYSFSRPKTDVCNTCAEYEASSSHTTEQETAQLIHLRNVKAHKVLKDSYLKLGAKDNDVLVLEFDYAQNYPIPKLNVCDQFYKRLIWVYLFNAMGIRLCIRLLKEMRKKIQIPLSASCITLFSQYYRRKSIRRWYFFLTHVVLKTKTLLLHHSAHGYPENSRSL